jgi:hypothetical protein
MTLHTLLAIAFLWQHHETTSFPRYTGPNREKAEKDTDARIRTLPPGDQRNQLQRIVEELRNFSIATTVQRRVSCSDEVKQELVLSGEKEYSERTLVSCKRIVLEAGLKLKIRNGAAVYFDATVIEVKGAVSIDGSGQPGPAGGPGESVNGEWQSRGDNDYWQAVKECQGNSGHPDRGKPGGAGGEGSPGAIVFWGKEPRSFSQVEVKTDGGLGGRGGPGGHGRLLKNGRNNYCGGCMMNCPSGPDGPSGKRGPEGRSLVLE